MTAGSTFGNHLRITTWGESHGEAIGVVIDGCPANLPLSEDDIQPYLDRRKPGQSSITTPRREADKVRILSGVFEGKTTGTPISLIVENTSQRSSDYSEIASYYRPGHADYTYDTKYGFRDYRGGGRSSGRETIGRVAAGAVAIKILKEFGIRVSAYTYSIGPVVIDENQMDLTAVSKTATAMPDLEADARAREYLEGCMKECDSAGGIIKCVISSLPAGIGEPVFEKLDAVLAGALMSIGAVKAVEVGDGILASKAKGSENNDPFISGESGISKASNHAGGILGGISDGSDITVTIHVKPTPSIFKEQQTVKADGTPITAQIKGRHDPVIVPRAVVVAEAMCALSVLDLMMANLSSRMEYLHRIYDK